MTRIAMTELTNPDMKRAIAGIDGVDFVEAESLDAATLMIKNGEADSMVAGLDCPTREVVLACKKNLPLKSQYFSSCFICKRDDTVFALSDGGINKNPTKEQLLSIVEDAAKTFIKLTGKKPRIALLSYSTKGSGGKNAESERYEYVIEVIRETHPDYVIDGEIQLDAAVNPAVAKKKCVDSPIQGDANVLIVPDLNTGNILYKALEQFGGFTIAGPIVQGFEMPLADLSRGSSDEDIRYTVETIAELLKN